MFDVKNDVSKNLCNKITVNVLVVLHLHVKQGRNGLFSLQLTMLSATSNGGGAVLYIDGQ